MRKFGFAIVFVWLMLGCVSARAQSLFNGQIRPGVTTRSDAEKALGAPLRQVSATVFDYKPPDGAMRLQIEYRTSGVVSRILVAFRQPYDREAMRHALGLPDESQGMRTQEGHLFEYFGAPAFLAFRYSSTDVKTGVATLGYFSVEAFESEAPAMSGGHTPARTTPQPASGPPGGGGPSHKPPEPFNRGISQPGSQATVPAGAVIRVRSLTGVSGQGEVEDGVMVNGRQVIPAGTRVAITQTMAAGGSPSFQLHFLLNGKLYRVRASGITTSSGWQFSSQEALVIQ